MPDTFNMYDIMPIVEINTPKEQCKQIAKRNAKKVLEKLKYDCDLYGIDLNICLSVFKTEISKLYKQYEGD